MGIHYLETNLRELPNKSINENLNKWEYNFSLKGKFHILNLSRVSISFIDIIQWDKRYTQYFRKYMGENDQKHFEK